MDADGELPRTEAIPDGPDDATRPDRPDRIGPYRLLQELGRGGMGVVFLAARADEQYEKRVALKVIKSGFDRDDVVRHFRRERQILASLEHPNIARFLDGGTTDDGLPYFVMEHVEGQRLDDYCDARRLTTLARLKLFGPVCSALEYAHRNLIVHRDLKPGNILVTSDGVPKLLDFGIAKLLNRDVTGQTATATGLAAMTPPYASPEQARGEAVSTASDVYSLGVVLYELLTGHLPYRLKSLQAIDVLVAVCEEEPEPPSTAVARTVAPLGMLPRPPEELGRARGETPERLRRRLRGDIDTILLTALRKEPARRYPSVEALSEDLRRYSEGLPIRARKPTLGYRARKFLGRHWAGACAAALAAALIAGFSISLVVQSRRVRTERDKAQRVSSFLVDLFKVSEPGEARGNTVTAREILDEGAERIRSELATEPEVRATLMDTMGVVYRKLGLYDKAETLLKDSLATRGKLPGGLADAAKTAGALAFVLNEKGDYAGAESMFREALADQRRVLGEEDLEVGITLNGLAIVLAEKDDYAEAAALFRQSLAIKRKRLGDEHREVATTMSNLANVLDQSGDLAGAAALHREALSLRRRLLGNEHLDVSNSLSNLAIVLQEMGDYPGAEAMCREALGIRRKHLASDHPMVLGAMDNLAFVLDDAGSYGEAEALLREALEVRRRSGKIDPEVATSLSGLARIVSHRGDLPGAVALYREALAMEAALGPGSFTLANMQSGLADVLRAQGNLVEAESLQRSAIDTMRKLFSRSNASVGDPLTGLGAILLDKGDLRGAEPILREALDIRRRTLPADHADLANTESLLGACLLARQRFTEAEPLLIESYPRIATKRSAASPDARAALARIVKLYEAWGLPGKAREYAARGAAAEPSGAAAGPERSPRPDR